MSDREPAGRLLDFELLDCLSELEEGAGNPYMAQLLEEFAADARTAIDRMRSLADCGKACAIAREAHRLRGSSGSLGAPGLAQGYGEIEMRARAGATRVLPVQIEATARLLDATMEALREFMRKRSPQTPRDSVLGP